VNKQNKKYINAPIVEALIDIHVVLVGETSGLDIVDKTSCYLRDFPIRREILTPPNQINIQFVPSEVPSKFSLGNLEGVRYIRQDGSGAIDARLSSFTYRVNAYDSWEVFQPEAQSLWEKYTANMQVDQVTRVALRYTNRFDVPLEIVKTKGANLFYPSVDDPLGKDKGLDQNKNLTEYILRMMMEHPDINAKSIVQRGTNGPSVNEPNIVPVVLDIDIFSEKEYPIEEVWVCLESLHQRGKNIFEESMTGIIREMLD
jgi:uncharacterized protein (TIGR04255 family)